MNILTVALPLLLTAGLVSFGAAPQGWGGQGSGGQGQGNQGSGNQGSGNCNQHSLQGRHGFTYSGSILGVGPIASSGPITFDGHGHLSANYTTLVNGVPFQGSFLGTYDVQNDGSGSVTLVLPLLGLQAHGDFVLIDGGKGTFFTCTDAGFSITGETRRM
ncbi:MAG: hypothetical protein KA020_05865 [Planctomycetes bacterium]|jgi:hypothetical protein|nr:hypothetical protein [Planctomycetota bacterium]MCC7065114.1 hypothetical protein [Planctomycetota bacterium]